MNGTDKRKLFNMFKDFKDEIPQRNEENINSSILLIDGNNTYMRSYSADPSLNLDGEHVGGINGFFKSIGYAIKMIQPTRCIIIFDGQGGSKKRQSIYKDYKNKRRTKVRLNRVFEDITPEEEQLSILKQMQKVVTLCQRLPVTLMAIDNIEADDTIAYLATEMFNKDETELITIMSNDKDFYQLVNSKVKIWSPTKKKMYGSKEVFDEFGISSKNFIYYRVLDGDKSDNIEGISGVGIATVKKVLPMICEETKYTLTDIIDHIKDHRNDKLRVYEKMYDGIDIIRRNYELMQLQTTDISNIAKMSIIECSRKAIPEMNVYEFTALLKKYRMLNVFRDHHVWLKEVFNKLNFYSKKPINV